MQMIFVGIASMKGEKDWTRKELMKEYVNKMTPVTIPVNLSIKGQQTIIDLSSMENILKTARSIAIEDCGCRVKFHKCDAPLDVCISLDGDAEEAIKGGARKVSKSDALVALKRSHEAGLVHMAYTFKGKEKPGVICSCCSCCCHSMSALVRFGIPDHVVASEYIASQNHQTCSDCGKCVERCQFHARQLEEGRLKFDPTRCFGCGVCLSTCPTHSITLIKRNHPSW
jgi:NAD-dependent dihydropyrimidine dehydrogenase PreA subunit